MDNLSALAARDAWLSVAASWDALRDLLVPTSSPTAEPWVSNMFDTREEAEAFRDEHRGNASPGSTAWVERRSDWVAEIGSTRAAW